MSGVVMAGLGIGAMIGLLLTSPAWAADVEISINDQRVIITEHQCLSPSIHIACYPKKNATDFVWNVEDLCLATMEAAMRAMEPVILVSPSSTEQLRYALTLWTNAKHDCWRHP